MTFTLDADEHYMSVALMLALHGADEGEVPVAALAVRNGCIIAAGWNRMERSHDATAHAEMEVLRKCSVIAPSWRLDGVTVYVTLEPCAMCAGALVLARVDRIVYGARDPKKGADGSVVQVLQHDSNTHHPNVREGVLCAESQEVLQQFFRERRKLVK
ncbi:MAG: tRNA adenosine(34) deaminase TadA [Candidatus Dormibacteria bacterium]